MKQCSLCDKPALIKGLCKSHYFRTYFKAVYKPHPKPIIKCSICGERAVYVTKKLCRFHYRKIWNKIHPGYFKDCQKIYEQTEHGKEIRKNALKKYRQSEHGKEVIRFHRQKRIATKKSLDFWDAESQKLWELQLELSEGYCMYCGDFVGKDKLTQDHIVPTSKKGLHIGWNTMPCCKPCNSSKNNKLDWKSDIEVYFEF